MKKILYIFMLLVGLASCHRGVLVSEYQSLPLSGWQAQEVMSFTFDVTDTTSVYNVVMNVRHTDDYPYQNIWLFADLYADSLLLSCDTLNYILANERGEWLGNGYGRLREMPMLYKQGYIFPQAGTYRVDVRQGMREELLPGVSEFGLTIEEVK